MRLIHSARFRSSLMSVVVMGLLLFVRPAVAEDIVGVQVAALDQPRIYMNLRRAPNDKPLSVTVDKESAAAIEAFLDTGSSGIVLATKTAEALKITSVKLADGKPATFEDVGVGGAEKFHVSEPLYATFAPYSSNTDGENEQAYGHRIGPVRMAIKPSEGLLEMIMGGLDIAGMAAIHGKVIVMDARPLSQYDKLKTSLLSPGDKSIPQTNHHVPLTMVSFARFTQMVPADAPGPELAASPMIGPNPFKPGDGGDARTSVAARHGGKSVKMTMLLDTGAACSMISKKSAAALGVRYSDDGSKLIGVPEKEQFSLAIGGIGGQKESRGFYIDVLSIPTQEGQPLTYAKAPVLVTDITVVDPTTKKPFTLDGVFGMNFLVATAKVSGGLLPDIGELTDGPFTDIVIDEPKAVLGLKDR